MSADAPQHRDFDAEEGDALEELRRQARSLAEQIEALSVAAPDFHGGDDGAGTARVTALPPAETEDLVPDARIVIASSVELVEPATPEPGLHAVDAVEEPDEENPETYRGVRFDDLPHPVPRRSRIRIVIAALIMAALAAGAFYAGSWYADTQRADPAADVADQDAAPAETADATETAFDTAGDDDAAAAQTEETDGDSVPASTAPPADTVDTVDEAVAVVDPNEVVTQVGAALQTAGYEGLTVEFNDGRLTVDGVFPAAAGESGYFAYLGGVSEALTAVEGVEEVTPRLFLRGNDVALRGELQALVEERPIEFEFGSAILTGESRATLSDAARVIQANPGLRVLVAGHTDASGTTEANAQLAAARASSVIAELVLLGVPVTRLGAVAYGELFPGDEISAAENRRVVFEVAP